MGKPIKLTPELFDRICEQVANSSLGLSYICGKNDIDPSTFYDWLKRDDNYAKKYARAKEQQADFLAEEILAISDDGSNDYMTIVKGDKEYNVEDKEVTNRSRLRVDSRKWLASKLLPKKYGDKVDLTTGGEKLTITFKE